MSVIFVLRRCCEDALSRSSFQSCGKQQWWGLQRSFCRLIGVMSSFLQSARLAKLRGTLQLSRFRRRPSFSLRGTYGKHRSVEVEVVLEKCWLHAINIQVPTILSCLQILVLFISAYSHPDFSGDQSISKSASPKGETSETLEVR